MALRVEDGKKLEVFSHWCLRIISDTRWTGRVLNDPVRKLCEILGLVQHILKSAAAMVWAYHMQIKRRVRQESARPYSLPRLALRWGQSVKNLVSDWQIGF